MSSLLRSTKFLRYFTGAARTLILNSAKNVETNIFFYSKSLASSQNFLREYATSKKSESLEPLLQRLDSELRRFGRISKRDIDEVFDEIRTKNDVTSSQSLLVIRCCGELVPEELPEQRTLLVQKIWSVFTERGVPMDISHYNALLKVYIENEHPFSPAEFLNELEKKGLQPNRVTYQRLMWRYCQDGDVEGATRVLEKMRELALPLSEPVLNALVMGHAFHGDTDGAKAVLDTMALAGLQPSNRTYTLLACGHAKKGDINSIEQVMQLADDKDIRLTDKDIMDIIEVLATSGNKENIDHFLEKLQKGTRYNQDALNLMLRLINKGQEEIAKKVMKTMIKSNNTEEDMYRGAFFVKQLLKINKPAEALIKIFKELQDEDLVPRALQIATDAALQKGHVHLALELFKEIKKSGVEIREHFYWPLLAAKGKERDEEGLLQIVRTMNSEGLIPTGETLRDYIIPFLRVNNNTENVILKLQVANVPPIKTARNLIVDLLENGEIKDAAKIAKQYMPWGRFSLVARPLLNSLNKTKDIESFVTILQVLASQPQIPQDEDDEEGSQSDSRNNIRSDIGRTVQGAVKILKTPENIDKLFTLLLSRGISISNQSAEMIEEYLGENLNGQLSQKLSKLASQDLELSPVQRATHLIGRTSDQLELLLKQAKAKDSSNLPSLKKQLLTAYVKSNDVAKVESFLKELEAENFNLTGPTLAQLVEFYSQNDDWQKAVYYKDLLAKTEPDFLLNDYKVVGLAFAFVKANKFDDAIDLLNKHKNEDKAENDSFLFMSVCWQMLNYLADQKDVEKVKTMTETIFKNKFVNPTNRLLGPLIKVHFLRDDLESALTEFERCCLEYRSTPWKSELTKKLILAEDAVRLQKLADLSTGVHGEVNTLYDLVLSFVECGRLFQARRILETPGLHTRGYRLQMACKRYVEEGKTECLEGLLEATKELSHIDRSNMFFHLLQSYCKSDETVKALGLWTLLQEEGEVPSDEFLIYLGKHLESKKQNVPFVIPSVPKEKHESVDIETKFEERKIMKPKTAKPKVERRQTKSAKQNNDDKIESLIQAGQLSEAVNTVVQALKEGVPPEIRILKFLLKSLLDAQDVVKMNELGSHLSQDLKKKLSFDNKVTSVIFKNGSGAEHVEGLVKLLENAKSNEDYNDIVVKFPRNEALALVVEQPDLQSKCHQIAETLAQKGMYVLTNVLWMEYLLQGRDKEANQLWEKYLINTDLIIFRRLLQESFVRKQPENIEKLIKQLHTNKKISLETIGLAYSRLISVYLANEDSVSANNVIDKAIASGIGLDKIHKSTLYKLKELVETNGQVFKYELPAKSKHDDVERI